MYRFLAVSEHCLSKVSYFSVMEEVLFESSALHMILTFVNVILNEKNPTGLNLSNGFQNRII